MAEITQKMVIKAARKRLMATPEGTTDRAHYDSIIENYPKLQKARQQIQRLFSLVRKGQNKEAALAIFDSILAFAYDGIGSRDYDGFRILRNQAAEAFQIAEPQVRQNTLARIATNVAQFDAVLTAAIQDGKHDLQNMARGGEHRNIGQERDPRPARSQRR